MEEITKEINLNQVKIIDTFWTPIQKLVTDVVIPYQEKILHDEMPEAEKSHAIENFKIAAKLSTGTFYGMVFQDSDVAKWLEAVAYSLSIQPNKELETRADSIIEIIEKAQQEDGYLNTYFTIKEPNHRWQNLQECHELYCAGHMIEAGTAYYEATKKDKLLKIAERIANNIDTHFGLDKEHGIPGHQEIELALMKLYHITKKEKYKKLARFFIEERGKNPNYFKEEKEKRGWVHFGMDPENREYCQCHETVYNQTKAVGHSVRAVYMYTAMADLAAAEKDEKLYKACERIWNNIVNCRMYLTGGIGSTVDGEAFSIDYDLPNDTVYAETCASIGLVFFAKKMLEINPDGHFTDIIEKALYNGIISGMQIDGKNFFYVNPLEVNPEISGKLYGYKHVLPQRPKWYTCACCPPNIARILTSLGKYAWTESDTAIYSHLLIGQKANFKKADIEVESCYPWEGNIVYFIHAKTDKEFTFAIHIPEYIKEAKIILNGKIVEIKKSLKKGYFYLKRIWGERDKIELLFEMTVRKIYANQKVKKDAGCVALMRGPIVYCFEGIDNGNNLQSIRIPKNFLACAKLCKEGILKGNIILKLNGFYLIGEKTLYSENPPKKETIELTAIPYYIWGNRGLNEMRVWLLEE